MHMNRHSISNDQNYYIGTFTHIIKFFNAYKLNIYLALSQCNYTSLYENMDGSMAEENIGSSVN